MTNSSNAYENRCAFDWGAIPGVLRRFRILKKDAMRASVLSFYCLHFVEKEVIFFNTHDFVIPMCKIPIDDHQGWSHIFEDVLEPTAGINNDNRNHDKQYNDILHKKFCKMFHICFCSNSRD